MPSNNPLLSQLPADITAAILLMNEEQRAAVVEWLLSEEVLAPALMNYSSYLAGTSEGRFFTSAFDTLLFSPAPVTYAASVVLNYGVAGNVKSYRPIIEATGDCSVSFQNLSPVHVGKTFEVTFKNVSGSPALAGIAAGTNNGVTIGGDTTARTLAASKHASAWVKFLSQTEASVQGWWIQP